MKVFVSSLITGMTAERQAVRDSIEVLGQEAVMAEFFGARPSSPQVACLSELRSSDAMVLVLGERYGAKQASSLSATHEEFREAKGRKPVLIFVREGIDPEPEQAELIAEASGWVDGLYRGSFVSANDLQSKVTGALHKLILAHSVAPIDVDELRGRALVRLPAVSRQLSENVLAIAIAAGPTQSILRPANMEDSGLSTALQQQALFGAAPIFSRGFGVHAMVRDGALTVFQEDRHAREASSIRLWETGDVVMQLIADERQDVGLSSIIEEDVVARLRAAFGYADWLINHIDPTHRLTHIAPVARLAGSSAFGWRTEREHAQSPHRGSMTRLGQDDQSEGVVLTPAHQSRAALSMDRERLVEDFTVLLRRQWK